MRIRFRPVAGTVFAAAVLAAATLLAPAAPATGVASRDCSAKAPGDASARELARTAQTVAETYATDHEGLYAGLSLAAEHRYEPTLPISEASARREHVQAYLYSALAIEHGEGYIVRARAIDGHTYVILRDRYGNVVASSWRCGQRYAW
jgi:hypothetical protein